MLGPTKFDHGRKNGKIKGAWGYGRLGDASFRKVMRSGKGVRVGEGVKEWVLRVGK